MKHKKLKVIIRPIARINADIEAAFEGKRSRIQKENEIVFTSFDACMKILTKNRLEILRHLTHNQPASIYDLAKSMGKDFKNVHTDVKRLADLGLITLEPTGDSRNGLKPEARYTGIEIALSA